MSICGKEQYDVLYWSVISYYPFIYSRPMYCPHISNSWLGVNPREEALTQQWDKSKVYKNM